MKIAELAGRRVVGSKRMLAVMLVAKALVWISATLLFSFQAPAVAGQSNEGYKGYEGPLVESHAHIAMYRSLVESKVHYRVEASGEASELSVASYVNSLDRNNIKCSLGFHAISFDEKREELLDHARRLLELFPGRFILFAEIFRHNPLEWFFDADGLADIFDTGLFAGFGEIQFENPPLDLDETPQKDILPNNESFQPIYRILGDRGLVMMAHPATRMGLGDAVSHDPRVTWIIHGPQVHGSWNPRDADENGTPDEMEKLEQLLDNNPNLYYTLDLGESLPEFFELTKRFDPQSPGEFLKVMHTDFDHLLDRMVSTWKGVIERHPDRFLWGTDMAFPTWQWHAGVFDMIVKFSRAFIGRLGASVREKFAYQNAEGLFEECK